VPWPSGRWSVVTAWCLIAACSIVVTSYALSGDDVKALAAGADAYVAKPFSPRALLARVRESLGLEGPCRGPPN
jgi:DNA-binding response OmpR family regulator